MLKNILKAREEKLSEFHKLLKSATPPAETVNVMPTDSQRISALESAFAELAIKESERNA